MNVTNVTKSAQRQWAILRLREKPEDGLKDGCLLDVRFGPLPLSTHAHLSGSFSSGS